MEPPCFSCPPPSRSPPVRARGRGGSCLLSSNISQIERRLDHPNSPTHYIPTAQRSPSQKTGPKRTAKRSTMRSGTHFHRLQGTCISMSTQCCRPLFLSRYFMPTVRALSGPESTPRWYLGGVWLHRCRDRLHRTMIPHTFIHINRDSRLRFRFELNYGGRFFKNATYLP